MYVYPSSLISLRNDASELAYRVNEEDPANRCGQAVGAAVL